MKYDQAIVLLLEPDELEDYARAEQTRKDALAAKQILFQKVLVRPAPETPIDDPDLAEVLAMLSPKDTGAFLRMTWDEREQ